MRFIFMLFALVVMGMPQAQATENRILLTDIHSFVGQANNAINNPNMHVSRNFLDRTTADNALIQNRLSVYGGARALNRVWYNHPAYGSYYRYPLNPYYTRTGSESLRKWDFINKVEDKKRMIPGYRALLTVEDTVINPYGTSAVVDVDLKEYGASYSPYYAGLVDQVKHSHGKCKMYLSKIGSRDLVMTRLDCNTNTSMPF